MAQIADKVGFWEITIWLFAVIIPALLIVLYLYVIWGFFPYTWFLLDIHHAEPSAIFLNAYMHMPDGGIHLAKNIWVYLATLALIIITYTRVLPKRKANGYDPRCFMDAGVTYLIAIPIFGSLMDLMFGKYFGMTVTCGFSIISMAFLGYLIWLMADLAWNGYLSKPEWESKWRRPTEIGVSVGFIVFCLGIVILDAATNPSINLLAHLTGFSGGLVIAWGVNRVCSDAGD